MTSNTLSTFTIIGIIYAILGGYALNVPLEYVVLASVIVLVAGMLPDIDGSDEVAVREMGGILAAIVPLVIMEVYPGILAAGNISRIVLIVLCSYILARVLVSRLLKAWTKPKGMIHSVPAAIITFQLVFLLLWDLHIIDRVYVSAGAFIGFFSHLFFEAYGNLDIAGTAMGKPKKTQKILKFTAPTGPKTFVLYACMVCLGYIIAHDFYPGLPYPRW